MVCGACRTNPSTINRSLVLVFDSIRATRWGWGSAISATVVANASAYAIGASSAVKTVDAEAQIRGDIALRASPPSGAVANAANGGVVAVTVNATVDTIARLTSRAG